ncbi:GNAT family N-acetyltransferase [uncultured Devosia sp.]|uniref:GNAT family N-acetyltransferase n=1 Tax=uncultured Devosia sp. TaxID=211434 RepID=UPI0026377D74|nr:GNAT family N-acetyltransferase [uncultured Devosia sp.]
MEGLVIRPARTDDIAALVALDTFADAGNDRAQEIALWVDAGHCACATIDGNLAGYAVMHRHFFDRPMLEMVMVGAMHRRQGVGEALIRRAIETAPGPVLWTSTNQSNAPMQSMLARIGFQRSGFIEGLDEGDPELIYRIAKCN